MARFPVYRYALRRPGAAPETRWSFQPVKPGGYAGNDEPHEAHPMGMEDAEPTQMHPAGEVEAPEGSTIVSLEPPMLELPGQGSVDIRAVIEEGRGAAPELGHLLRWHPR